MLMLSVKRLQRRCPFSPPEKKIKEHCVIYILRWCMNMVSSTSWSRMTLEIFFETLLGIDALLKKAHKLYPSLSFGSDIRWNKGLCSCNKYFCRWKSAERFVISSTQTFCSSAHTIVKSQVFVIYTFLQ